VHDFSHQRFGSGAEGALNAALRAEEIRDHRVAAALDVVEEERRPPTFDDAAVDFGEFEVRINFCVDIDEIVVAFELFQE
jgi:hypothetical protein